MIQIFVLLNLFLNNLEQFADWTDFPWIRARPFGLVNFVGILHCGYVVFTTAIHLLWIIVYTCKWYI